MSSQSNPRRQSTFRAHGERGYTKLRNDFLQNPKLSHETIGLVAQMLSRSPEWQHTAAGMAATSASGIKKVWRMLAEAEEAHYIRRAQPRDHDGKFAGFHYLVSDDPETLIRAVAEEIDEIQRSSPHTQNGSAAPHSPQRSAAKRCTAKGMQEKKESRNECFKEKKESLSPDASASATEPARESEFDLFKELISTAPWHPATNGKAARNAFASLSPEDQQHAVGAAMLYAEACDKAASGNKRTAAEQRQFNKSLHKWLAERGFDLYPDAAKELVPGMPGVRRSVLTARVRNFLIERDRNGGSQHASWPAELGPKPGEPGSKVPAEIIDPIETEFRRLMDEERAQRKVQERYEWNGNLQASMCDSRLFMTRLIDVLKGKGNWKGHLYGPAPGEPGSLMDEHYSKWIESAREQIAVTRREQE